MSARALARAGLPPVPQIDISSLPHPQYVNDEGYEVDEEPATAEEAIELGAQVENQLGTSQEALIPTPVNLGEQVLDLAERYANTTRAHADSSAILPFTLIQSRQRHLTGLLPHIFSHPPIPSHSKPKAKPLPKGRLIFPTPAPAPLPLPLKEYHAATRDPGEMLPSAEGESMDKRRKKRGGAPAHEIECIARVTLSIGPLSFPETELWIGRFVEPRGGAAKVSRKRDPAEQAEKRRKAPVVTPRRVSVPGPSNISRTMPGLAGPSVLRAPHGPSPRPQPAASAKLPLVSPMSEVES